MPVQSGGGRRFWRPPVSGYTSSRYGDLATHPFTTAPVFEHVSNDGADLPERRDEIRGATASAVPRMSTMQREVFWRHERDMERFLRDDDGATIHRRGESATTLRALSPSERALHAMNGTAVPVSPDRATKAVAAGLRGRTSTLPHDHITASRPTTLITNGTGRSTMFPNGTTRTTDLLSQFPHPPSRHPHSPAKRPAWTLFPRLTGGAVSPQSSPSASVSKNSAGRTSLLRERLRRVISGPLGRTGVEDGRILSPMPMRPRQLSRALEMAELAGDGENEIGDMVQDYERLADVGSSGPDVYELEDTSPGSHGPHNQTEGQSRAHDSRQAERRDERLSVVPFTRATSALTDVSRYFSAASHANLHFFEYEGGISPAEAEIAGSLPGALEEERPITDGGERVVRSASEQQTGRESRFVGPPSGRTQDRGVLPSRPGPIQRPAATGSIPTAGRRDENTAPTSRPSTGTWGGKIQHCKHNRSIIPSFPLPPSSRQPASLIQLDGHGHDTDRNPCHQISNNTITTLSTTPPPPTTQPRQQPSAADLHLPPISPAQSPSQHNNDDRQTVHIRHLHHFRAGTWRTRMGRTRCWRCALHESRLKGWARLRRMMGWTCFCRFRAYEEESEEEEREMAVLAAAG
ncbi:hypothetical protein LTR78_004097 [Recurvomyces mirabilis]|uniref:Uncharacterized protein n=1 Tax=Recurvomyces mirabilis TaxID=574656 RepID=A0AAE0WQ45_9PEZI|nr:hypothetical protein LTR78_004097 [Recurvomyces mirabilis]KAK5153730.1 hypothetical protein LTS14_007424 [Recurvomyces mirabilis]